MTEGIAYLLNQHSFPIVLLDKTNSLVGGNELRIGFGSLIAEDRHLLFDNNADVVYFRQTSRRSTHIHENLLLVEK